MPISTDWPTYQRDFLGSLTPAIAEMLCRRAITRRYRNGTLLVHRGQEMHSALVVTQGRLRIVTASEHGKEHLIRWVEPGEAVGVGSVVANLPLPANLVAAENSEVLWIPGATFMLAMHMDNRFSLFVSRHLATRLSELADHVAAQVHNRLEDRLRTALQHLATKNGEHLRDGRILLRATQQDMSDAIGASRQRVSEALHELQRGGGIELGYRCILIQPERLGRITDRRL